MRMEAIVVCRRHRSKRENRHSMDESCCLQDNRSKRENCCLREPSSFAGGIVPSARIVILCTRVASVGDLDYLGSLQSCVWMEICSFIFPIFPIFFLAKFHTFWPHSQREKLTSLVARESSFAGAVVPSARIVIVWVRIASCRRIVLHMRIAVCRSHRRLWEPSFSVRIVVLSENFCLQEKHSERVNCWLRENRRLWEPSFLARESSFYARLREAIVPCARIVIVQYARGC